MTDALCCSSRYDFGHLMMYCCFNLPPPTLLYKLIHLKSINFCHELILYDKLLLNYCSIFRKTRNLPLPGFEPGTLSFFISIPVTKFSRNKKFTRNNKNCDNVEIGDFKNNYYNGN